MSESKLFTQAFGFVQALRWSNKAEAQRTLKLLVSQSKDFANSPEERNLYKRVATIVRAWLKDYATEQRGRARNPVRKKRAKKRTKKKVTRKRNPRFTKNQLAQMRKSFAQIGKVDPTKPTYAKVTKYLDGLSQPLIKQLAGARIKFLSGLAQNRIKGKA